MAPSRVLRGLLACLALGLAAQAAAQPSATDKEKVGFTALVERLGASIPTGAGILVSQTEADESSPGPDYFPNTGHADFAGKTITAQSGASSNSNHATSVGLHYYGLNSFSPGPTQIDVYRADHWLTTGRIRVQQSQAPLVETADVLNHSWIGAYPGSATNTDALRRLDYLIERDEVVVCVGVNNGSGQAFPALLGNAYNAITVGRSDGNHSAAPSSLDVPGRAKIDLVAPGPNVSVSTPWVASAATLLLDAADGNADAMHSETIKAALLAGATKSEFDLTNATPTLLDNWSRTTTRPLDFRYGAGELNIDHAHRILTSPQQESSPASLVNATGWDYDSVASGESNLYFFEIPEFSELDSLSIIATWNRQLSFTAGSGGPATFSPSLANVDLKLYAADGSFSLGALLDSSVSTIDNVEHIFQQGLAPGRYAIELLTGATANVALAWDAILTLLPVPGDANGDRLVDGGDFTVWSDNYGDWNGDAEVSHGDFNGDGFVDGGDFTIWSDNFGVDASIPSAATSVVPEPGTLVLAALALAGLAAAARRHARST